ncbi:MAG: hypothetical protein EAY75_08220 [Bacteroidetes bacterium]|nr:MAG: hypothetical protein EAY75_08220 [Bacteroidota bacterium]
MHTISINKVEKATIVLLIPRGEAIRNFIYSGIADELRKQYRLVFLSIIPNNSVESLLRSKCDAFYELEAKPKLTYATRLLIDQTDLAHNRYLWSEASKLRWKLRDAEARGIRAGISDDTNKAMNAARYKGSTKLVVQMKLKKFVARLAANATVLKWLDGVLYTLAGKEPEVRRYQQLLADISPVLVFNTSHIHSLNTYPVMQAAKINGVATAAFLFSWDNLTSQGRIFPHSNFYLSWSQKIKNQLLDIYPNIANQQVLVTGTPQFTFHFDARKYSPREDFLAKLGLLPQEKYVLYSVGLSHNIPFEDVVAERIADMLPAIDPSLRLVIRTYAKDPTKSFEVLAARRPDIIIPPVTWIPQFQTPSEDDQVLFTNLLLHCTIGVNVGSTVSLELAMFDKPVIYVGYDPPGKDIRPISYKHILDFDHLRPIVKSGAFAYANSEADMQQYLSNYYTHPSTDREKRRALIEDFFEVDASTDSKLRHTDTLVAAIKQIAEHGKSLSN